MHPNITSLLTLLYLACFTIVNAQNPPVRASTTRLSSALSTSSATPTFNSTTSPISATSISETSHEPSATASPTAVPAQDTGLNFKIDGAYGAAGAVLILSGLPVAFAGTRMNNIIAIVMTAFYAGSLAALAIIIRFGIEQQISPPKASTRGLFLLACVASGGFLAAIAAIFNRGWRICVGPIGAFLFGVVIQCVKSNGLIGPIGLRYLLFIALATIGFLLSLFSKLQQWVILVTSGFTGALAVMLGIDCYSTAGLKEFVIYNMGFTKAFPLLDGYFPLSSTMTIELGAVFALAICGCAAQYRFGPYREANKKSKNKQLTPVTLRGSANEKDLEHGMERKDSYDPKSPTTPTQLTPMLQFDPTSASPAASSIMTFAPTYTSSAFGDTAPLMSQDKVSETRAQIEKERAELAAQETSLAEIDAIKKNVQTLRAALVSNSPPLTSDTTLQTNEQLLDAKRFSSIGFDNMKPSETIQRAISPPLPNLASVPRSRPQSNDSQMYDVSELGQLRSQRTSLPAEAKFRPSSAGSMVRPQSMHMNRLSSGSLQPIRTIVYDRPASSQRPTSAIFPSAQSMSFTDLEARHMNSLRRMQASADNTVNKKTVASHTRRRSSMIDANSSSKPSHTRGRSSGSMNFAQLAQAQPHDTKPRVTSPKRRSRSVDRLKSMGRDSTVIPEVQPAKAAPSEADWLSY